MEFENLRKAFEKANRDGKQFLVQKDIPSAIKSFRAAARLLYKMSEQNSGDVKNQLIKEGNALNRKVRDLEKIVSGEPLPAKYVSVPKSEPPRTGGGNNPKPAADDGLTEFKAAKIPEISFDDIAGLDDVKKEIRAKMINPMLDPELSRRLNIKSGGGMLLYGPPGTGKTMIAKATAHEVGAVFYVVKGSDIVSKYVGESERNINALFTQARQHKKAVIFFDELDSIFATRGSDPHNDKRVNELLQQMEGFSESSNTLFYLGATNNPWNVDSAAKRPGRFSVQVYVPLPDEKAREYLINRSFSKLDMPNSVNVKKLIERTEGYSGADINEIIQKASHNAFDRIKFSHGEERIIQEDVENALSSVIKSVNTRLLEQFERYKREISL